MPAGAKRMAGKICLVSGATSGIGAATALSLAREGATVIGIGRDPKRCASSAEKIIRATGNPGVDFLLADLSVRSDIHALAKQFKARYPRLDVLVNNAGARFSSRLLSADGCEMTFALNHLGYFLLTALVLEKLKQSGHARIVNVASGAHRSCPGIDFEDLNYERNYSGKAAYAQSKLANILFTYELDRRLKGTAITANAAAPGNVLTRFSRNNGWASWLGHVVGSLRSGNLVGPAEGAETVLFLACSPKVDDASGGYFSQKRATRSSNASFDTDAAKRLWQVSEELTELKAW